MLHSVALSFTTFRLYRRFKSNNFWWDDHWAFFALLMDMVYFAAAWMRKEVFGEYQVDNDLFPLTLAFLQVAQI